MEVIYCRPKTRRDQRLGFEGAGNGRGVGELESHEAPPKLIVRNEGRPRKSRFRRRVHGRVRGGRIGRGKDRLSHRRKA